MSAWDEWDRLLAEPTPDPLEVIKLAARYQRYLDAVQMKASEAELNRIFSSHSVVKPHPCLSMVWACL